MKCKSPNKQSDKNSLDIFVFNWYFEFICMFPYISLSKEKNKEIKYPYKSVKLFCSWSEYQNEIFCPFSLVLWLCGRVVRGIGEGVCMLTCPANSLKDNKCVTVNFCGPSAWKGAYKLVFDFRFRKKILGQQGEVICDHLKKDLG